MQEHLPQLRVLDSARIYCYEWPETTIPGQEMDLGLVLSDPFPVVHLDQDRYLLLEDAERFRSLVAAGLRHLPVQVCDETDLVVSIDSLALFDVGLDDILDVASENPDGFIIPKDGAELPDGYLEVRITQSGDVTRLFLRRTNCVGCPEAMQQLFRMIEHRGSYQPIFRDPQSGHALCRQITSDIQLHLPPFTFKEIAGAVTSGRLFPPQAITVTSSCRVFDLDFPISVLRSAMPATEKEGFLRELIPLRAQQRRLSVFTGQVFRLNR